MKWISSTVFALFRVVMGLYLTIHFYQLLDTATEIFSNQGVISDATLLPSYGKLPLFLLYQDDPQTVYWFIFSLFAASLMFTLGIYRRTVSMWLFYGWMCLLNRNPLISNPSLGYIGWLLLACTLIPKGERLGFLQSEAQRKRYYEKFGRWEVPDILFYGMWIIIGISYTASGVHKLQCPDWWNGTALYYVLTGPLVRKDNPIVAFILSDMMFVKMMTWGSLFLEVSALFFGTFYRTRKYYWAMFMGFHLGIVSTVNFTDLTFGMMIAHLFTFDPSWFSFTRRFVQKYDWDNNELIEHDINHTDGFNSKRMRENYKTIVNDFADVAHSLTDGAIPSKIKKVSAAASAALTHDSKSANSSQPLIESNLMVWIVYAVVVGALSFILATKGGVMESLDRITQITMDMYWGFGFLAVSLGLLMILERIYPDQKLANVPGWWRWVLIINTFQLFAVILASFTWENWLQNSSYFTSNGGFHLRDHVSPFTGGLIAYIINQWLFYHWHKARHEVYFLWILFHQFHHSPSRIETITSFYKHPLEIVVDSQIMAILLYSVLGLTAESSIWLSIFSGIGEYVYHMNIKTPKILGYFFQRPESHRCHHRRNARQHCPNYSDFPGWDILGGTFENPERMDEPTGFHQSAEIKRLDMLLLKDVLTGVHQDIFSDRKKMKQTMIRYLGYLLVIWGTLNSAAFLSHHNGFKEIGFATVSSPLPLVFSSFNGVETFATGFNVDVHYTNGTMISTTLDVDTYGMMKGAYNRRNIYGAIFSHGPFFDSEKMIQIRQGVLNYAVCNPGTIINEFGVPGEVDYVDVDVLYRPQENKHIGSLHVHCQHDSTLDNTLDQ